MKSVIIMLRKIAGWLLLLFAANVSAALPDSGWYFNATESGRGFNIEIQNNVLFIAGFMYDGSGNQIWVYSGGPMSSDHTYSGAAYKTVNGQPLGGAYQPPTNVPFGTATITWVTTMVANITINGYSFTVTRQLFGIDPNSTVQGLLGEFAFVMGTPSLPVYFGQRITFTGTQVVNGILYAVGTMTGDPARQAIGNYSSALSKWIILLDSSPSYYQYFSLTSVGLNYVEGTSSTYLKTDSPTGSSHALGHRIKSAQAAAGANAPGTTLAVHRPSAMKLENLDAALVDVQKVQQFDASDMDSVLRLQHALEWVKTNNAMR